MKTRNLFQYAFVRFMRTLTSSNKRVFMQYNYLLVAN